MQLSSKIKLRILSRNDHFEKFELLTSIIYISAIQHGICTPLWKNLTPWKRFFLFFPIQHINKENTHMQLSSKIKLKIFKQEQPLSKFWTWAFINLHINNSTGNMHTPLLKFLITGKRFFLIFPIQHINRENTHMQLSSKIKLRIFRQ